MAPTALAPAPSRATTTITLSFGVMAIPLSVYTGVEETRVKRSEFLNADTNIPVGRAAINKATSQVVASDCVVRMAQADNGAWVVLTDDEIADCTTERGLAEVVCFVRNKDVSRYLVNNVKQVRPKREKGKANPAAEKAFALLLNVLERRKLHALVYVAMRGPAQHALLDSKGNLYLVHSADQVRQWIDLPSADISEPEMALAEALVDAVGVDAPILLDTTAVNVKRYVNEKASGITPPSSPTPPPVGVDIMAQLQASIDAMKQEGAA